MQLAAFMLCLDRNPHTTAEPCNPVLPCLLQECREQQQALTTACGMLLSGATRLRRLALVSARDDPARWNLPWAAVCMLPFSTASLRHLQLDVPAKHSLAALSCVLIQLRLQVSRPAKPTQPATSNPKLGIVSKLDARASHI